MFNPKIDQVIKMCETMAAKHMGEMNYLTLDWKVVEMYDARYQSSVIQQLVPLLVIDFK